MNTNNRPDETSEEEYPHRKSRYILFSIALTIAMLVYASIHYYIYRRLVWGFGVESKSALWVMRILIVALAFSYPTARVLTRIEIGPIATAVDWFGSCWMGLGFYLLLTCAIGHLIVTGLRLADKIGTVTYFDKIGDCPYFIAVPLLVLALGCSAVGFYKATRTISVTSFDTPMKNLPAEMDGFKIVQISDIHLGVVVNEERARKMVEEINSLAPDLVVITGDFVDEAPGKLDIYFGEFKKLNAKYGVLACTGNHEFYHGVKDIVSHAAQANIRYLRNEKAVVAGGLLVYGVDDPGRSEMGGRNVSFEEVIGPEAKSSPTLLLYHRPKRMENANALGVDLMLCGHTHNGQLWPFKYVVSLFFPRITGHFTSGKCHMYVSRGIGTWGPPVRLGSQPEIVEITLRAAGQ